MADAPPKRRYALEPKLNELFGGIALGAELVGDPFAAQVISKRSSDLAHAWAKLADANPAVKRILQGLTEGSAWGEVAMVSLSVAVPILWARGLVPDEIGVPLASMVAPESDEVKRAKAAAGSPTPPPPPSASPPRPGPTAKADQPHPMGAGAGAAPAEPGPPIDDEVHPMGSGGNGNGAAS